MADFYGADAFAQTYFEQHHGQLVAYVALCNYEGEAFLEGPLLRPELSAAWVLQEFPA